jgi:hypothetical protein
MPNEQSIRVNEVSKAVDDLFLHFGVWTTVKAMVFVAWQHRHARLHVSHLSDHLRRDIGLPVNKPLLGKPLIPPWHPRF